MSRLPKTAEEYLWDLKMTFIKALPPFLVASLAFSEYFSYKEFSRNAYLLFFFVFWVIVVLAILEITIFGLTPRTPSLKERED